MPDGLPPPIPLPDEGAPSEPPPADLPDPAAGWEVSLHEDAAGVLLGGGAAGGVLLRGGAAGAAEASLRGAPPEAGAPVPPTRIEPRSDCSTCQPAHAMANEPMTAIRKKMPLMSLR